MATVKSIEMRTTSTNKPFKSVTLDEQVLGKDKFNVFQFHTRYNDVVEGRSFAPEEFEPDGQYIKLIDPDKGLKRGFGGNKPNSAQIAVAQAQKAQDIKTAQDNTSYNVRVSSSMRDAVLLAIAEGKPTPENIVKWRGWVWREWENVDKLSEPPF